jgi:hypothetical protein
MDADQVRDLSTAIYSTRAGAAGSLALPQTNDQLLAKLAYWQRVDGVVDGFAADVNVFKFWEFHTSKFAGNLLRREVLSQQVDQEVEQFATRFKLARRPTGLAAVTHLLVGLAGRIGRGLGSITTKLTADGRGAAFKHPGNGSLAQTLKLAELDRDAFFNTEFLIGHAHTVPDWSGVALSFCRCQGY